MIYPIRSVIIILKIIIDLFQSIYQNIVFIEKKYIFKRLLYRNGRTKFKFISRDESNHENRASQDILDNPFRINDSFDPRIFPLCSNCHE